MKVKVVMGLDEQSDAEAVIDGRQIVDKMSAPTNTNFNQATNPINPTLTTVTTSIDNLENGIVAAQHNGTGPTQVLRQLRHAYDTLITRLAHYVEDTANDISVPDLNREGIVTSAGMDIKTQTNRQKNHFEARNTDVSGTVQLIAEGLDRGAHQWEYTSDTVNFTGRIAADATVPAHTDIHNLTVGTKYAFFHKKIVASGPSDWEGPVTLLVI